MYKKLNDFQKSFNKLKIVHPQTDNDKVLKEKVLDGAGGILMNCITFIRIDTMKKKRV